MQKALENNPTMYPVLPLRDVVVYPHMVIPLFVGRKRSIQALELAMSLNKQVVLLAQRSPSLDDPKETDLYKVGTVATILQLLKLPDGTIKVLVEGNRRVAIEQYYFEEESYQAEVKDLPSVLFKDEIQAEALVRTLLERFEEYVKFNKKIPTEILTSLTSIDEPGRLADTIAAHMSFKLDQKQTLLELVDVKVRLERLITFIESEADLLQVQKRISGRVKRQMEKNQREYYLNEQMKAIQKELREIDEGVDDVEELLSRIEKSGMPEEAKKKAMSEFNKLKMMAPMSAEATVSRNYLDWMLSVPWKKQAKLRHDLPRAETILEREHYGLDKVKERILEYLAVQQRVKKIKGPILCLVGPPGVGKTSLGQSIAEATGRPFVRMALGGVRDEAEIRGHRRTYIGSMPGKIIQKLCKTEVKNALFLLDEVDKMAMDFRGDPASALLEVLDPEQNSTFNDHYLEVDYDLSEVLFIATANSLNIPAALLDRMEVIRLPGYTEDEKQHIALRHLLPKQLSNHGLTAKELKLTDPAVLEIIRYYTREAGVRNLEREISKICRKLVKEQALAVKEKKKITKSTVDPNKLEHYLGVKRFHFGRADEANQVGQVTGLAWTEVGGDILRIEAAAVIGKGKILSTGHLGDVMQESIQAALTVVRSRYAVLGIEEDFYSKKDIHIHVPEGATPKDGPSAGIGMCTALVSVLTQIPVKAEVAMTGEITLRGEVLPIGGLKEKLLAAHRGGIKTVIIPKENERDLKEIPSNVVKDLDIRPVRWIDEVLAIALERQPLLLAQKEATGTDLPVKLKKGRRSSVIKPASAH